MAYTINLTDGTIFATIPDGTINTSSSMTLVGKNYAGYGAFLDENFIHLLETGSNSTAPTSPLTGQLWWDSANTLLKVFNGTAFKVVGGATAQSTPPSSNVAGDLWYNTVAQTLYVYTGSTWLAIGPSIVNNTGAVPTVITDNLTNNHDVVELIVDGDIVGIISKDVTFTPATTIPGFATISPGYNVASAVNGIDQFFNGTATNSLTLQGFASNAFMRTNTNTSTTGTLSVLNNTGLSVGASSDLSVGVSAGNVIFTNQTLNGNIDFKVNIGGTSTRVLNINGSTGTISGIQIDANYADVAERFEADAELTPGTVVELGGSAEITCARTELSEVVFGVISTHAAFTMNSKAGTDLTHPRVAMTGRVPVRAVGQIYKGDRLVSAGNGIARAAKPGEATAFNVIGRALRDKLDLGEGTVEAIVTIK